jgi:DNA-binding NtrC family response regulator
MRGEGGGEAPPNALKLDGFARLNLVGASAVFLQALRLIERIAAVDAAVLIQGETGTGKELAARALHYLSSRSGQPFVPVNCGALPDSLLESELFGHERGAFTDARQAARGLVAQAEGGTLFLDEVEAMTPRAQVVLLRFLEDHQYRPVGGRQLVKGDLRIIAATNIDLEQLARGGRFRDDLMFRLRILSLTMPPLRRRDGDALLLAEHFLRRFVVQYKQPVKKLHRETAAWLAAHQWPGNVRELQNFMLREFLLADSDTIHVSFPDRGAANHGATALAVAENTFKTAKARAVAEFERVYLDRILTKTSGNIAMAARIAGTDRSALNKLVKKHGFAGEQFRRPSS